MQVHNDIGCSTCKATAEENALCVDCGAHHRQYDTSGQGRCREFEVLGIDCRGGSLGLCTGCKEKSAQKEEAVHLPGCPAFAFIVAHVRGRPAVVLPKPQAQPPISGEYVLTVGLHQGDVKSSPMLLLGQVVTAPFSEPLYPGGPADDATAALVICGVLPKKTWTQPTSERFLLAIPVIVKKCELQTKAPLKCASSTARYLVTHAFPACFTLLQVKKESPCPRCCRRLQTTAVES